MSPRIIFLVPYPPGKAPSQRFRFEQYLSLLHSKGYDVSVRSFFSSQFWPLQSKSWTTLWFSLLRGTVARVLHLLECVTADIVFIHREAAPFGPPLIELIVTKVFRKRLIFDFDDAIWLTDNKAESAMAQWMRSRSKVAKICSWSWRVSCGNDYLCRFATAHATDVILNPSTIDASYHRPSTNARSKQTIVIGWTGSYSTLKYLDEITEPIKKILDHHMNVNFMVIADERPSLAFPFEFRQWDLVSEIEQLDELDIGIMPLPEDEWTKGKCGFKLLQYMAMAKPVVASPVGVNVNIVQPGMNGFLATTKDDWFMHLSALITQPEKRRAMGMKGRALVEAHFSTSSNAANFLSLFAK